MKRRKQFTEVFYRVLNGHWCAHTLVVGGTYDVDAFTPWRIVDGMRKWRWCQMCGRSEFS